MIPDNKNVINIVLPVFNEEGGIAVFYEELIKHIDIIDDYEFVLIFVDDGSNDDSNELIQSLALKDNRVRLITFTRNFGHQEALRCGLRYCTGSAVITMDTDLQHPPKIIPILIKKWEEGYDIVNTIREGDKSRFIKHYTSDLFYKIFNKLSDSKLYKASADFRLISSLVLKTINNEFEERNIFFRGLMSWMGYKQSFIKYDVNERFAGKSKFTFKKMLSLADRGFSYFSLVPIKLGLYFGLTLFGISFLYFFGSIVYGLIAGTLVPGWTSLLFVFLLISSVQFILIGILGIYIGHIFTEVKKRPTYIVESTTGFKPPNETR